MPFSSKDNDTAMQKKLRVAILGGGTIARLVLECWRDGVLPGIEFVALSGRRPTSLGARLGNEFGVPYVLGRASLLEKKPDAVLEAASHEAVREHLVPLL